MPLGNASRTANILEHKTPRCSTVSNTPSSSNSFAARRDSSIHRAITIIGVYYVEGLNHNLFSVGQFCDADLEVAFRMVFNKRTRIIVETIHVNFDELPHMASDHVSSDPGPQCSTTVLKQDSLSPGPQSQENVPQVAETVTTSNELELLYSPMFSELLNGNSPVVSKSSAVHAADNLPLTTPVQEQGETSSRHVDSSNMHTFYQHHPSAQRWTKDHPLEQVIGNPSQLVRTRRQLETDDEMCMFALTVNQTKPKNIKEAMVDSAWIESMQEELHQMD
ncbi:hypothetical protein Tco_0046844 [Tanacetum coccineum]